MKSHLLKALDNARRRAKEYESGDYIDIAMLLNRPNVDMKAFRGDIWGIVAPSGGGKSTWMVQLAAAMAHQKSMNTLYISPEVSDYNLYRRMIQMMGKHDKHDVMLNSESYFKKYQKILESIYISHDAINHHNLIEELQRHIASFKDRFDILVIDHMKLMKWDKGDMRTEIEAFCGFIKKFASEQSVIVWLVNQVPKSAVSSYGGKTRDLEMTDVSEASGIYQILDGGIVINAPFGPNSAARKISIGKARDGNAAALQDLYFKQNPNYFLFEPATLEELRQLNARELGYENEIETVEIPKTTLTQKLDYMVQLTPNNPTPDAYVEQEKIKKEILTKLNNLSI